MICLWLCCFHNTNAQEYIPAENSISVEKDGIPLQMPWLGGLNNPQYSEMDFNDDGLKDLFVFDRSDNQSFVLINTGNLGVVQYEWDQTLSNQIPEINHWATVKDYNCDEVPDIFAATDSGVKLFTGSNDNGILEFTETISEMTDQNGELVSIALTDIPAIIDVNDDGHIDILTFNPDGGYIFFYENLATECGEILLEVTDSCWGNFYESGISENSAVDLFVECGLGLLEKDLKENNTEDKSTVHPGSTILAVNLNENPSKELILGDVSFDNLVQLNNAGTLDMAMMDSQDVYFPVNDDTVNLRSFPAAFSADVNNDGLVDILVSPNNKERLDAYYTSYYFQNVGSTETASFSLQQKDFLIDEMVEVGEFAHPAFFDHNADGLLDLVIGNRRSSQFGSTEVSSLFLFENVGTSTEPAFSFVTNDYLNLSELQFEDLSPTFGDIDGDGALDLICGTGLPAVSQGLNINGTLIYLPNKSQPDETAVFAPPVIQYQGHDAKQKSAPQLVDVNLDGLLDLIVGNHNGKIFYYENQGTAEEPVFVEVNDFFGEVDVRSVLLSGTGHARPFLTSFTETGERYLMVGSETGAIFKYELNLDSLESGSFELLDSDFLKTDIGTFANPLFADLDNDGKQELFVGIRRGGIKRFVVDVLESLHELDIPQVKHHIFPNPSNETINIVLENVEGSSDLAVYNNLGQQVYQKQITTQHHINVRNWSNGLYFFVITNSNNGQERQLTHKVTVQN